jgi:iron complex transport system substrate-binding protein
LPKQRIIADPYEVVLRQPDIIIGSWQGRPFNVEAVRQRPGWATIPAVRNDQIHEIKPADIRQPGPAALTDGLWQLHQIVLHWAREAPK